MQWYLSYVKHLLTNFESFTLEQVPQSQSSHVDSLATLATSVGERLSRIILVENLVTLAYNKQIAMGVNFTQVGPSWMDPIVSFLKDGNFLEDRIEAEKTCKKVSRYWLSEEQKLYKCLYSRSYSLCVQPEAIETLLDELHEGVCGSHIGGRSLSHRALTQGY